MRQKQRIRRQSAVCLPLRDSQRLVVVRIVLLINTYLVYAPLVRDTYGYTFSLSALAIKIAHELDGGEDRGG